MPVLQCVQMKTCKMCHVSLPLERFSPQRKGKFGVRANCKGCLNAEGRRIRRDDPATAQKSRDQWKAWYHARKASDPSFLAREWASEKARRARLKAADPDAYAEHLRSIGRASKLRTQWALSVEEYDALVAAQAGVCAICHRPEMAKRSGIVLNFAVDHDHNTGQVRGLLCMQCNNGLGRFSDDPERLRAAAAYLERTRVAMGDIA